jgi:hypothetical protein
MSVLTHQQRVTVGVALDDYLEHRAEGGTYTRAEFRRILDHVGRICDRLDMPAPRVTLDDYEGES